MASKFGSSRDGGSVFDSLKSRLGFGDDNAAPRSSRGNHASDDYDAYGDEYSEEDDFGEYGAYAGDFAEEFAEYGPDYDDGSADYDEPRSARRGSHASAAVAQSSRSAGAYRNSSLVTIDDVKARAAASDNPNRDSLSQRQGFSTRTVVDERKPAPQTPVAKMAAANNIAMEQSRSEGLNSLFNPTIADAPSAVETPKSGFASANRDSREAFDQAAPAKPASARGISVIKPVVYGDVAHVAKVVKSGDVVVIALRNTPDDLSKRILDFSFGVASALDASVECPGEKVFVITRGTALSDKEKEALIKQGVL